MTKNESFVTQFHFPVIGRILMTSHSHQTGHLGITVQVLSHIRTVTSYKSLTRYDNGPLKV